MFNCSTGVHSFSFSSQLALHISVVIKYRKEPVAMLPNEWIGSVGFISRVIAFPTGIPGE